MDTLTALEWRRLVEALRARLATPYGDSAVARLPFYTDVHPIRHSLTLIDEMKALREAQGPLDFAGVQPIESLLDRAAKQGRLEAGELAAVLATQRSALRIQSALRVPDEVPGLRTLAGTLHPERAVCNELGQALTPGGELNEQAFPELGRLRQELASRRAAIHARLEGLLRSREIASALQDDIVTLRGRRYVLAVKADFRGHLRGIVHDVSSSGATLFMEPEAVVEDTNALTLAERQLEMEVDRILGDLSRQVGNSADSLRDNLEWLGHLDLLHAQAVLSTDYQGTAPQVEREGRIVLHGAAHPLMLLDARGVEPPQGAGGAAVERPTVVRNDLRLGGDLRCMVISGANTGGKTVSLKCVGLCALLVRCGMHIPARAGSRFDLFTQVWADIGDQQSLETDLSTFSAQVRLLADLLPGVGADSLVLLDEMLTGTEPAQGAALARVVLEALLERGATTVVTTHFSELKVFAAEHPGMLNASVSFDLQRLRPTFRLQTGIPGASYGLEIARRYGLSGDVVARAERHLAEQPAAMDSLLIRLQAQEHRLNEAGQALQRRTQALDSRAAEVERKAGELAERDRSVRYRERGQIGAELRQAREKIASVIRELQQANSLPVAGAVRRNLDRVAGEVQAGFAAETAGAALGAPIGNLSRLPPGTDVYLPSLGSRAVLEDALDEGRRARVRVGLLSMEVGREELTLPPPGSPAPVTQPVRASRRSGERRQNGKRVSEAFTAQSGGAAGAEPETPPQVPFALPTTENTLDLRGMRLHEALERCEQFFDQCTVKHITPVVLIHGHGTGRLKAGLRDRLRDDPYVGAFRAGEKGEGQDGVTVVALNV